MAGESRRCWSAPIGAAPDSPAVAAHGAVATGSAGPEASSRFLRFLDVKKSYDQKQPGREGLQSRRLPRASSSPSSALRDPGKTTVLMLLAGFEASTGGDIRIGGASVTGMPPYRRNIGMVFQNYALFPHMTVSENLAYPLTVRGVPRAEYRRAGAGSTSTSSSSAASATAPAQLSGGQRQRVALARALIFEPSLVLMDEPLGALDRKLREQMQFEITRLHKKLGFTVIYVTHDQTEALTMSDRVAVFNDGRGSAMRAAQRAL